MLRPTDKLQISFEIPTVVGPICGVDEAGRGPLAGPVTAAAVILSEDFPREVLADSKVLTRRMREEAENVIRKHAAAYGIGWATHEEIDRINILQASLLAMSRAVEALGREVALVLVDGNRTPVLPFPSRAIIGGDAIVPEIMAASILAKTARDRWMIEYAKIEPQYLFEKHKGYPTAEHRRLIGVHGPSRIHRRTFQFEVPASL
ncbi:MAG TPA: ribonuclease HII [Spirochaetia bacterium]|nr:ribonuclease HII [Spirochaetia bacterium]